MIDYSKKSVSEQISAIKRYSIGLIHEVLKNVVHNDRIILNMGDGSDHVAGSPEEALFTSLRHTSA